ncbi:MAG TPA: PEP-CTERM sorting domain-containing protein, partial [Stellaceae bacterium]|nr:PEP-CTERM sorting domain-containing protein [Stellaceae bacterium]
TINDYLDFAGSTSNPGQLASGEMLINITDFSDAFLTGIGFTWQLFAVVSDLSSSGGTWSGNNFNGATGTMSGTIDIYGISGSRCNFSNTATSASITGCSLGSATLLAQGSLTTGSYVDVNADSRDQNATETFNLNADLTSDSSILLPSGTDAIALNVNSGIFSLPTPIAAYDPPLDYGTGFCTSSREPFCFGQSQAVNWSVNADPDPVPEPTSLALFTMGMLGFGAARRRKRA